MMPSSGRCAICNAILDSDDLIGDPEESGFFSDGLCSECSNSVVETLFEQEVEDYLKNDKEKR